MIGERSFGADPDDVTRLAGAWMRGAGGVGIACCLKHFPGHGDTAVDSHYGLPVVDRSPAQLEHLELRPVGALSAQAPSIMTAHIVFPRIDAQLPATLSPRVLGGLLRDAASYDGVVVTDSLSMGAVSGRHGIGPAAVLALQAGADPAMVLGGTRAVEEAAEAIAQAAGRGTLQHASLQRAQARLDRLAARYPAGAAAYPRAARDADDALMREAWARSLATVGAARPPAAGARLRILIQRFGSAANLNIHLHCLVLDGLFRRGEAATPDDDGSVGAASAKPQFVAAASGTPRSARRPGVSPTRLRVLPRATYSACPPFLDPPTIVD